MRTAAGSAVQLELGAPPARDAAPRDDARLRAGGSTALPRLDRHFRIALVLATLVVVGRSVLVARQHSENLDTQFHLRAGVAFLTGNTDDVVTYLVDPPLGDVLLALPMILAGADPAKPIVAEHWAPQVVEPGQPEDGSPPRPDDQLRRARAMRRPILYGHAHSPETLLTLIAAWKAILFVPAVACAFQWCRALYGTAGGWLAAALLVGDPTIAAHVATAALDSLALGAAVVACFAFWRYFERPATWRLAVAGALAAAGLLIKQTAVVLPGVFVLFAMIYWVVRPWRDGVAMRDWLADLRPRFNQLALFAIVFVVALWALTGFDVSPPARWSHGQVADGPATQSDLNDVVTAVLQRPWPAGVWLGAFRSALALNAGTFPGYLWDQVRPGGWWYYFPVLATYKAPLGFLAVALLGLLSLVPRVGRPRWGELSLLVPLAVWAALLMTSGVNVGFRHALIPYAFALMLASRCAMASLTAAWRWLAFAGVAAGWAHVASYHPDYHSYLNFPRHQWWLHVTDSNFDWGQAAPQVRAWIDANPHVHRGRAIHLHYRWSERGPMLFYYLGDRVHLVDRGHPLPSSGLLIISPVWLAGVYEIDVNPYAHLRARDPIAVIGHAMLVYDLDTPPERGPESHTSPRRLDPAGARP